MPFFTHFRICSQCVDQCGDDAANAWDVSDTLFESGFRTVWKLQKLTHTIILQKVPWNQLI